VSAMHTYLQRVLGESYDEIQMVRNIFQSNLQRRFDIYGAGEEMEGVLKTMKESKFTQTWLMRHHIPYHERRGRGIGNGSGKATCDKAQRVATKSLVTMTWNANKLGSKWGYTRTLLDWRNPDILAIQETGRKPKNGMGTMRMGGYSGLERTVDEACEGSNGLATLVSRKSGLSLREFETKAPPSPYCLPSRVLGLETRGIGVGMKAEERDMYLLNVYVPCSGAGRRNALRDIAETIREIQWKEPKGAPPGVIIMGDWNMRAETLRNWLRKNTQGASLCELPDRAVTWWRPNVNPSRIDHIVSFGLIPPR
jgi:exonuclease III